MLSTTITCETVQTAVLNIKLTEADARSALSDPRPLLKEIASALETYVGVTPPPMPKRAKPGRKPKEQPALGKGKAGEAPALCPTCRMGFKNQRALRLHTTRKHPAGSSPASAPAAASSASA